LDIDLAHVPLVDEHCHGIWREPPTDVAGWRSLFTESTDPRMRADAVAATTYYRRLVREMADVLGCESTESAVIAARAARGADAVLDLLWSQAHIGTLVLDTGFPADTEGRLVPHDQLARAGGLRVAPILRVELTMQALIAALPSLAAVSEGVRAAVSSLRQDGYVGLKSIIAYRTGLAVCEWPDDAVLTAFRQAKAEAQAYGHVRLTHKPLLDTLLLVALEEAAAHEVPVQFHTGYGDTDADVRLANPLHMRWLLENPALRSLPFVLLHESYPYTREAAILAAQYGNVYLDLDYGIPFLGQAELLSVTRAALAVAPSARLLYSSDGVYVPEVHWSAARWGRRLLGQALGEMVENGECSVGEAERIGRDVLATNAQRLYGLPAG
jgi:uncharacterized protein